MGNGIIEHIISNVEKIKEQALRQDAPDTYKVCEQIIEELKLQNIIGDDTNE